LVIIQFLNTKARVFVISSCKGNIDILKVGLLNVKTGDEELLADEEMEDLREAVRSGCTTSELVESALRLLFQSRKIRPGPPPLS
jgi:tRNA(Phe) wybutosine-synthesizing methylase Tyw3